MYRIGVDVGGTNTDSAIVDVRALNTYSRSVLASSKTPTTIDITSGIQRAIEDVLAKSKIRKADVLNVTIGTTHFVNAVVEADERRLSKVAVVRLCGPYTKQIPPFSDFPLELKRIINGGIHFIDGGLEIDGREICPLNVQQIKDVVKRVQGAGTTAIALVGVFSPLDHTGMQEKRCKKIMFGLDPSLSIVCSSDIGPPGLLERENAAILNASILSVAKKTIDGFRRAMARLQLTCPLYLTQNDGSLTDADSATENPIKTFASGPTNSMIGAAFLAGLDNSYAPGDAARNSQTQVLVVDIGGTTTDVCALLPSGFPRQAPNFVDVGGVRTGFSMPEVCSVGLGGGSRIDVNTKIGEVTVGPDSVGHFLSRKALVFGGTVMTATDIVVASKKQDIGNGSLVAGIPLKVLRVARQKIKVMLEKVIEDMKVSAAPVTVLLVGGGSILYMDELEGVANCICPPYHDAANAVGAAIAKVSGEVDVVELLEGRNEEDVVASACDKAIQMAVRKGADKDDVKIVEIDKIPLPYINNRTARIMVKAVGRLALPTFFDIRQRTTERYTQSVNGLYIEELTIEEPVKKAARQDSNLSPTTPSLNVDIPSYRPDVRRGVWYLSEVDVEFIASGTGVLGTGGGGSSYLAYLVALDVLRNGGQGKMRVISPRALKNSDMVCFGSYYGAPSVFNERIPAGTEIEAGIDALKRIMGLDDFDSLIADEIGGGNGLAAFPVGCHYDKPVLDADTMGRAYPTMEHSTLYINGHFITPCAITDAKGNSAVIMSAESNARVEKMLRTTAIELGLGTAVSARPLPGSAIKEYAIPNTVSQAWYIGRAIHMARKAKTSFVKAIFDVTPGRLLFSGKIIDVRRDTIRGYTMGSCLIAPVADDEENEAPSPIVKASDPRHVIIPFQNEYLYAAYTDASGIEETEIIGTVPDLISILGADGEAIGSQDLRYGLKVSVIGLPAHPLWTEDEKAMKVGGPEGFGLSMKFKSLGKYEMPRSVIDDFETVSG